MVFGDAVVHQSCFFTKGNNSLVRGADSFLQKSVHRIIVSLVSHHPCFESVCGHSDITGIAVAAWNVVNNVRLVLFRDGILYFREETAYFPDVVFGDFYVVVVPGEFLVNQV